MRNILFIVAAILLATVLACDWQVLNVQVHNLSHVRFLRVSTDVNDLEPMAWAFLAAFNCIPLFAVWAGKQA